MKHLISQEPHPNIIHTIRILLLRAIELLERIIIRVKTIGRGLFMLPAYLRWGFLFVGVALLLLGSWWISPKMELVRGANVVARSMSVAWVSNRPGWGCIMLTPIGKGRIHGSCDWQRGSVHLVTFEGLTAQTTYRVWGLSGIRPVWQDVPQVTTAKVREEQPPFPKPGYGSVVDSENRRQPGSLVLVYTMTNLSQYPVAVLVNAQGNYAVPLANLARDGDSFLLQAYASAHLMAKLEADVRFSTPFPPLRLERVDE